MLNSFRRLSQSKVGAAIMVLFLLAILASFALSDINGMRSQTFGGDYLAKAGSERVTAKDYNTLADRALAAERQNNPDATMANIVPQLPALFEQLIDDRALAAFATANGLVMSKSLIDGQIASLPVARGLDGKFSMDAYNAFLRRERLTDAFVREAVASDMRSKLMLTPIGTAAHLPVGVATQYASMLLEERSGEMAIIPTAAFVAGLNPSAGDLQTYYAANKGAYMVPEQRVLQLVSIGAEQVAKVEPTDADIAAYYKANASKYAAQAQRVISQATVPDQAAANAIAQRAKAGGAFAAAAAPAGIAAADTAIGLQTEAQYRELAGDAAAKAVFGAAKGAVIGPIKTSFGWTVAKVEDVRDQKGRTVAEARGEIRDALLDTKRKDALADLVGKVEDAIADGSSLVEAAKANGLSVVETPAITAQGRALTDPAFKLAPQFAPALRSGFSLGADEDPVVETDPKGGAYTVVGVGRIMPSAPAPLADVKDRVRADWIAKQAMNRARTVAQEIAGKVAKGMSVADAAASSGGGIAKVQPVTARRLQLTQANPAAVIPLRLMFSLAQGKSRLAAAAQGQGFFVVKTNKIVPGNALTAPGLVVQTQQAFSQTLGQELAAQFTAAVRSEVKVKRNDDAIKAAQAQIAGPSAE